MLHYKLSTGLVTLVHTQRVWHEAAGVFFVCGGAAANRSNQSHAAWLNKPVYDMKGQGCTFVKRGSSRSSSWLEAGAKISIRRTSALPTCSIVTCS